MSSNAYMYRKRQSHTTVFTRPKYACVAEQARMKSAFARTVKHMFFWNTALREVAHGLGAGFVPKIFDRSLPTRIETVSTEEAALWVEKLARTEGLAVGLSTGANLAVAARYASRRENKGKTLVTVAFSDRFDNL